MSQAGPASPLERRSRRPGARRLATLVLVLLATCTSAAWAEDDPPSILRPGSEASERVEGLWWVMFWISAVVVALVIGFIVVSMLRRRKDHGPPDQSPVRWGEPFIAIAGLGVSGAVLAGTFVVSLAVLHVLSEPPEKPSLTIEVEGRNWWWNLRYPEGMVTANEIHIPAGRPVEIVLSTFDVIHSFWVPQLQVKMDTIPGQDNRLWLDARKPGRYRGQCAEYCGLQHAHMAFDVVAMPPREFRAWLAREAQPAADPQTPAALRGRDIFLSSSCAGCHRIRGTRAEGELGPDLTHLASRATIGAGVKPLTAANLADFVLNAQDDKLGATMPPTEIPPDQLGDLVEYLMQLH